MYHFSSKIKSITTSKKDRHIERKKDRQKEREMQYISVRFNLFREGKTKKDRNIQEKKKERKKERCNKSLEGKASIPKLVKFDIVREEKRKKFKESQTHIQRKKER